MADIPSAILDSNNSMDSIFALELDTKQRFDNILSGLQKPIEYPIPDFQKDQYPNGLPQDSLLNPSVTKGTLGEALFSPDKKVSDLATDQIRQNQANLPTSKGVGVPERFPYDKSMDKYLKGDFGYNPYLSLEKNEDFNYRYDYANQGFIEKGLKNIGTGLTRLVGSIGTKLGQTIGYLGSMAGYGVAKIFDPNGVNFTAGVADNSLSRWFEGLEEDMKNSNLLSVFKPAGWQDKGFFSKLGYGSFWTDEVVDGAAFMGEMVLSNYLLGGLGKIAGLAKLGETEIATSKFLAKYGQFAGKTGKAIDFVTKLATGAEDIAGIGRWALNTTAESAMEAADGFDTITRNLKDQRAQGLNNYSDEQIRKVAGDRAAGRFKANLAILSISNAFENKFIFEPLFGKGNPERGHTLGKLIGISDDTSSLEELAKGSRKTYDYSTWLGKKLDWKNANSRLRFYGGRALSATAMEGFWEENAQLAAERLANTGDLSWTSFWKQTAKQTLDALKGKDPEAAENIGLGGLIGILGTGAVAKMAGAHDKNGSIEWFRGERKHLEGTVNEAINSYEKYRKEFLSYNDVYQVDKEGKPILDEDGNMQIDDVKALGIMEGTHKFANKQAAISKIADPLLRKSLQDDALADYVHASKAAGVFGRALNKFTHLESLDENEVRKLGFDPNTTVDAPYLKDSIKEIGKIHDKTYNEIFPKPKADETQEDDNNRRFVLYKSRVKVYSSNKLANEYMSTMMGKDYPSVFSPEAQENIPESQQYNSLIYQEEFLNQWANLNKDTPSFFDEHIKEENARITKEKENLRNDNNGIKSVIQEKLDNGELKELSNGLIVSPSKYKGMSGNDIILNREIEDANQIKHAQLTNTARQYSFLSDKLSNPSDGIANLKKYEKRSEAIENKDSEVDNKEKPQLAIPEKVETPIVPIQSTATNMSAERAIIELRSLYTNIRALYLANEDTDFQDLTDLANKYYQSFPKQVEGMFLDELKKVAEPYKKDLGNKDLEDRYEEETDFITEMISKGLNPELVDRLDNYIRSIDDIRDAAQKPEIVGQKTEETPITPKQEQPQQEDTSLEAKKADIERKRQEDLNELDKNLTPDVVGELKVRRDQALKRINNKYDSELAALEGVPTNAELEVQGVKTPDIQHEDQINSLGDQNVDIEEEKKFAEQLGLPEVEPIDEEEEKTPIEPPKLPPLPPPPPVINSDSEEQSGENDLDIRVDEARQDGKFTFVQMFPSEIVTDEKGVLKITNGALQLKTTHGDQQEQLLRQHNTIRKMSSEVELTNFFSINKEGNRMFKIKLVKGDEQLHEKWVYQTAKGLRDKKGNLYKFPNILAVITDNKGKEVYFDKEGTIVDKTGGQPVAFVYSVTEYLPHNLDVGRRGVLTGNIDPLVGGHGFENVTPIADIEQAILRGVDISANIDAVTSGKMSSYNVDNSPSVKMKPNYQQRSISQMIKDGDLNKDSFTMVLRVGNYFEYATDEGGKHKQLIKVGQPLLYDRQSGIYIALNGKKVKDLTLDGKALLDENMITIIKGLQKDGQLEMAEGMDEYQFDSLYQFLRSLFYSKDVSITKNKEGDKILYFDNRPITKPLMDYEVNYNDVDLEKAVIQKPYSEEQYAYKDFVMENFTSGAVPAEVEKDVKRFEKLNKRVIFTLEMSHSDILASMETTKPVKTIRIKPNKMGEFVGKTYQRSNGETFSITSYNNGVFTVKDNKGKESTIGEEQFKKNLTNLKEVTVPAPTDEIKAEFEEKKKLSKEKVKELLDKAKDATDDDLKDISFDC